MVSDFIDWITGRADEMTKEEAQEFEENFGKVRFYKDAQGKRKWYVKR